MPFLSNSIREQSFLGQHYHLRNIKELPDLPGCVPIYITYKQRTNDIGPCFILPDFIGEFLPYQDKKRILGDRKKKFWSPLKTKSSNNGPAFFRLYLAYQRTVIKSKEDHSF